MDAWNICMAFFFFEDTNVSVTYFFLRGCEYSCDLPPTLHPRNRSPKPPKYGGNSHRPGGCKHSPKRSSNFYCVSCIFTAPLDIHWGAVQSAQITQNKCDIANMCLTSGELNSEREKKGWFWPRKHFKMKVVAHFGRLNSTKCCLFLSNMLHVFEKLYVKKSLMNKFLTCTSPPSQFMVFEFET